MDKEKLMERLRPELRAYLQDVAEGDGWSKASHHQEIAKIITSHLLERPVKQPDFWLCEAVQECSRELTDHLDTRIGLPLGHMPRNYATLVDAFGEELCALLPKFRESLEWRATEDCRLRARLAPGFDVSNESEMLDYGVTCFRENIFSA